MIHGKKAVAAMNLADYWGEILAIVLLIIGFILAVASGSAVISYAVILFAGMILGRLWYKFRNTLKLGWVLVILGFLAGYILGSQYGNRAIIIIFFVGGFVLSYATHKGKVIKGL